MVTKKHSFFLSFAMVCTVFGCASEPETVVGKPPVDVDNARAAQREMAISLDKPKRERPTGNPVAIATLPGWPLQEEGRRFTLTWAGGGEPAVLLDEPNLNGLPVAEAVFKQGDVIRWADSVVGVFQPTFYTAKTTAELEGFELGNDFRTGSEMYYVELKKGERVAVMMYGGSGLCIMEIRQRLVEALCPDAERFSGNFSAKDPAQRFHPPQRIWWVFVGHPGQGGWMASDNRVVVDIH